jgi:LEA14-like dessication related protein
MRNARPGLNLLAAALFLAASSGLFAISIPKSIPTPTAEVTDFRLEAISLRDVTFKFVLEVKNPYPVGLSFDGMTLNFTVEGAKVMSVASQGGFSVKAKGVKSNSFTVTLTYASIIKLVKNYIEKDWLNTVIDGTLVIPIPKVPGLSGLPPNVTFEYKFKKKIPAIKPQVAILDFSVKPPTKEEVSKAAVASGKKVNPDKAAAAFKDLLSGKKPKEQVIDPAELDLPLTVSYTISVRNEAKGPLTFNKLGYELLVNGETLVAGESAKVRREGNLSLITVDNVFSSKKLSKNVKALFADRGGRFGVKGSASIKLPDEIRKEPVTLSVDEAGSFKLR